MGEYIRKLRTGENKYGKIYTQEKLGQSLNPPVNRAAINKWETGRVENIKRTYIEQLSDMFGIEPTELMCFESKINESPSQKVIESLETVRKYWGNDAVQLLEHFIKLNPIGKRKALNDITDLSELSKYANNN